MSRYDFLQLSSLDFEELVRDLLQAEWGVRLESFTTGRDSGIDLRYATERANGSIIQCKHYATSGIRRLLSNLKTAEAHKVSKLNPPRYVVATSVGLTPHNKAEILSIFSPYIQSPEDIFGRDDLNNLIRRHPDVEQANFKLWFTSAAVFDRVVHNAERCQTDFELDRVRSKLRLYVQNDAYRRALKILNESNIVIISGVPGIGKTTLAEMLLYEHLEKGYEPVVIRSDVVEAKRLFRRKAKQVFYFDDFLGQTFLRDQTGFLLRNQDQNLVDFMEMIRRSKSARFVLTTREHILQNAILLSERLRHSPLLQHHIILELSDYSFLQKGRILYNHLYFSDLPAQYKRELLKDDFYLSAIKHDNFNPRIIEWLSSYTRIKNTKVSGYRALFERVLNNPAEIWRHAFEHQISEASRNISLSLYSVGGEADIEVLENVWTPHHRYKASKYNFRTSPGEFKKALKELDGAFLRYDRGRAAFLNPSIKDFVSGLLSAQPEFALDLIETSGRFEQAARLWHLATSPE